MEAKTRTVDLKNLKAGGFIKETGRDEFTIRLRVPGGRLPVERLKKIAEVAGTYGAGFVHLTVRQAVELVHVRLDDFDAVVEKLGEAGQEVASCGARVRVPTACGGCEYNPNGLMDTQRSAAEIDQTVFGVETGHGKFKVSFSGCPNDCPKSSTNDLGFIGAMQSELVKESCIGCGLCEKSCTEGAIKTGEDGRPSHDPERCINCGDCVKICPAAAWQPVKTGYTVYAGGKWGRRPMAGATIADYLPGTAVVEFTSEVLAWYKENAEGKGRARLGDLLAELGTGPLLKRLEGRFGDYLSKKATYPLVVGTRREREAKNANG